MRDSDGLTEVQPGGSKPAAFFKFYFKVRCRFLLQLPVYSHSSNLFYLKA